MCSRLLEGEPDDKNITVPNVFFFVPKKTLQRIEVKQLTVQVLDVGLKL